MLLAGLSLKRSPGCATALTGRQAGTGKSTPGRAQRRKRNTRPGIGTMTELNRKWLPWIAGGLALAVATGLLARHYLDRDRTATTSSAATAASRPPRSTSRRAPPAASRRCWSTRATSCGPGRCWRASIPTPSTPNCARPRRRRSRRKTRSPPPKASWRSATARSRRRRPWWRSARPNWPRRAAARRARRRWWRPAPRRARKPTTT